MGNSRFSDGFLIGALIGGVAIYLLVTPKGKKILKSLTEEGQDVLTDFIENLEENHQGVRPMPQKKEVNDEPAEEEIELESPVESLENNTSAPAKRFFKRK